MSEDRVILYDSDEAAVFEERKLKMWWSNTGRGYKDERLARSDGCSHRVCECGEVIPKLSYCEKCREKKARERFEAMEVVEWDWETPVCIHDTDMYFFHHEDIEDHCIEHECKIEDLELVLCTPNYPRQIDEDYWCDEMPEDGELPTYLQKALEEFNGLLAEAKPLSWSAGNKRVVIKAH